MKRRTNRRRRSRRACALAVEYRVGRAALGGWRPAEVLDLTAVGCRLRIGEPLAKDTKLRLRFAALLADGAKSASLEAAASVQWTRAASLGRHVGLRFEKAPAGLNGILAALGAP
jgi:hypothetical protein